MCGSSVHSNRKTCTLGAPAVPVSFPALLSIRERGLGKRDRGMGTVCPLKSPGEVWGWAVLTAEARRSRSICGSFLLEK